MSFLEGGLAFCNREAGTEHDVYLMQGLSKSLLYFCLQSTIALLIVILEIHTSLEQSDLNLAVAALLSVLELILQI